MHSWRCKCPKCRFEAKISTELIALIAPVRVKIAYFGHLETALTRTIRDVLVSVIRVGLKSKQVLNGLHF